MSDHIHLLHELWRNLFRGDKFHNRPGLPIELVTIIFRLADDLHVPIPIISRALPPPHAAVAFCTHSGLHYYQTYLCTLPLSLSSIRTLCSRSFARLDIVINFHDENKAVSHTWFEVALSKDDPSMKEFTPTYLVTRTRRGTQDASSYKGLKWPIHRDIQQKCKTIRATLGPEHEIWKWVAARVGGVICLMQCTDMEQQQMGMESGVREASFRFFKYFKPVIL